MYVYVGSRRVCFAWQLSQQEQFHSRHYSVFQELILGGGRAGDVCTNARSDTQNYTQAAHYTTPMLTFTLQSDKSILVHKPFSSVAATISTTEKVWPPVPVYLHPGCHAAQLVLFLQLF